MHISEHPTKIFLDSGDPSHTQEVLAHLGFLDGQTTNPSLVAKSEVIKELQDKGSLSQEQLLEGYRALVNRVHEYMPEGSISIEVYADADTTTDDMIEQAHMLNTWLPNPHIKLPITVAGLEAATQLVSEGININMTLCFSQEQAYAVHLATLGARPGQVFVSPFVGRLDDKGICGVSLVENIVEAFSESESHVEVLAASIRSVDHISACVDVGAHILTIPHKLFEPWCETEFSISNIPYESGLERIAYKDLSGVAHWRDLDIQHDLTDVGLQKFADDWNNLIT